MWTKDKSELMIYELVGKGNQKNLLQSLILTIPTLVSYALSTTKLEGWNDGDKALMVWENLFKYERYFCRKLSRPQKLSSPPFRPIWIKLSVLDLSHIFNFVAINFSSFHYLLYLFLINQSLIEFQKQSILRKDQLVNPWRLSQSLPRESRQVHLHEKETLSRKREN